MAETNETLVPETAAPEKEQILPDGIGLKVEEVQKMLLNENKVNVPKDDPVLMIVTIMNAALTEQAKLQKAHEKALGKMMSEHTKSYIENTANGMKNIMETLSTLTAQGLNDAAKDMVKYRMSIIYCTVINFIAAMLVAGVFILKAVK